MNRVITSPMRKLPDRSAQPLVAIVGRPNVGKSALFNRLVRGRIALVEDLPGTTRDRLYGDLELAGRTVRVVDTGGLESMGAGYAALIRSQVEQAVQEADAVVLVVDALDGPIAADHEVADMLRRSHKSTVLVANKADNQRRREASIQFYELGLGEPLAVSAYHDSGIAELLDALDALLPVGTEETVADSLRIAIVGRPNVGKSSLLNAILGEERVIVSDVPGTTRDAIDTTLVYGDRVLTLIDTAGIRRRGHIDVGVEKHSVLRAQHAIERADVVVVVTDATELGAAQDSHIVGYAEQALKSLVIVVNKVDLIDRAGSWASDLTKIVRARLKFAPWAPVMFVSALTGTGIDQLLATAQDAGDARDLRVPTPALNNLIKRVTAKHSPPSVNGKRLHVLYVTQADARPPTFVFFVNDPTLVHFSYLRYLENQLRATFGFHGTPLQLIFKNRSGPDEAGLAARSGARAAAPELRK